MNNIKNNSFNLPVLQWFYSIISQVTEQDFRLLFCT